MRRTESGRRVWARVLAVLAVGAVVVMLAGGVGCGGQSDGSDVGRQSGAEAAGSEGSMGVGAVVIGAGAEVQDVPEKEPLKLFDNLPGMDVQSVKFATDGSRLTVTVILDKPYTEYIDQTRFGAAPVQIYLDIDNNEKTGGKTFTGSLPGFEYKLKPLAGLKAELKSGDAVSTMTLYEGGTSGEAKVTAYLPSYSIQQMLPDQWPDEKQTVKSSETSVREASRFEGVALIVAVPYEQLGLKSGQVVRLRVQEMQATGKAAEIFLPELRLKPQ